MNRKEQEEKISEFWEKNKIFQTSVEQRPKNKQYVFYDGPPFATGLPHYGHILGLTCKDLFPRYATMRGFRVERRWGWDCHGLPIENIAEKELGLKEKKDIEKIGIDTFNEFCRSKVLFYAQEWKKTVRKMGKWIEFDNSYKTMDNSYMESVWHIFKTLSDKGYIYEGKKVLLYCPRCETPLSNTEIAMDNSYKNVTEKTAVAKFELQDEPNTFILAWTTTPWTLIGNVALAINSNLTYVKIKQGKESLILAKDRLSEVAGKYETIAEFKGEKILKKQYKPLYPIKQEKQGHYIINGGNEVSAQEGTGIVHMALYGEFDYEMIKKYDLPVIQHIGNQGKLLLGPKEWEGTWFKKADKLVLEDLEQRSLLFKADNYTHPYPFCYRCETPLFYNAVDSWFVNIQKIKSQLLKRNQQITWHPEHLKEGRFKDVLETAPDWSISRNRFWATSIPVWKCTNINCKHLEIIGSIKELQEKATTKVPDTIDLHKHVIDTIELRCIKCKGNMKRIPEVLDCWFESASMPYAAEHYPFENKEHFKHRFPADFISEYIGQTRAWFYYMHVIGVLLFDQAPFKHIVVDGNVLAADGAKMSKSKKNFPDPNIIFEKYGADALRFYLMSSTLMKGQDLNFKEDNLNDLYRKVIVILENVKAFYELFGKENKILNSSSSKNILDQWIISKLHLLLRNTTTSLDQYDTVSYCTEIITFIDDLSTWYVRRSRDRFKSAQESVRKPAIQTLGYALATLAKVMAPITPFIAEEIHQTLRQASPKISESVHLELWPQANPELINEKLHEQMTQVREIVSQVLQEREKAKIPVRQVLSSVTLKGISLDTSLCELIKDEVNIKEIKLVKAKELAIELDTNLNKELLAEGLSREFIRKVNDLRKELKLTLHDHIELTINTKDPETKDALTKFQKALEEALQADKITFGPIKSDPKTIDLKDEKVLVAIKKL